MEPSTRPRRHNGPKAPLGDPPLGPWDPHPDLIPGGPPRQYFARRSQLGWPPPRGAPPATLETLPGGLFAREPRRLEWPGAPSWFRGARRAAGGGDARCGRQAAAPERARSASPPADLGTAAHRPHWLRGAEGRFAALHLTG